MAKAKLAKAKIAKAKFAKAKISTKKTLKSRGGVLVNDLSEK